MRNFPCRPSGDPEHRAIPIRNLGLEFADMLQTPNPMNNSDSAINGPVASPMPSASPIQASRLSLGPIVAELDLGAMDLPAEEQVLHVIEGLPIPFMMELVPQSEPNKGLKVAEASDQAVGDQTVGQQCNQAEVQPRHQAEVKRQAELVDQALAYFRSFYAKDGQLVSFSFLVSRALRKENPVYAEHWDALIAQHCCERPDEAEKNLENEVGKKFA